MRKNSLIWLALIIALVSAFLYIRLSQRRSSGAEAAPEGTLTRVLREKRVRVGYINYPPSTFRDPATGQARGLFVDVLNEIITQLDPSIEIAYEETTWTDFSAALTTGRIDLSIAGTFSTIPRAKVVAFSRPLVYLGRSAIVRRGDARFSSADGPMQFDRPDVKVAVVEGEGSHEFVRAKFKNQNNILVFSGSDLSQCLAAVSSGQADVGMSDALEVMKYARSHPEVIDLFSDNPYDLTPICWAVRQDDLIWKDFLDTALATLEVQGKIAAFEANYDYRWSHPVIEFRKP